MSEHHEFQPYEDSTSGLCAFVDSDGRVCGLLRDAEVHWPVGVEDCECHEGAGCTLSECGGGLYHHKCCGAVARDQPVSSEPCANHCGHDPQRMIGGACHEWLTYVMDYCGHRCASSQPPVPATVEYKDDLSSLCCGAPILVWSADEGTSSHQCSKCGQPCDLAASQQPAPEPQIPAHLKLWLCSNCLSPRLYGSKPECYACGFRIHDTAEYIFVPEHVSTSSAPIPQAEVEALMQELRRIARDGDDADSDKLEWCVGQIENLYDRQAEVIAKLEAEIERLRGIDPSVDVQELWQKELPYLFKSWYAMHLEVERYKADIKNAIAVLALDGNYESVEEACVERMQAYVMLDEACKLRAEKLARLEAVIAEIIGAELNGESHPDVRDDDISHGHHVTFGMLRRARAALKGKEK